MAASKRPREDVSQLADSSNDAAEATTVAAWEAARRDGDFELADAIRSRLRAAGINPDARPRASRDRYDAAWAERTRALRFISTAGYLASSVGWELSPKLQTFRAIATTAARDEAAATLGRGLRARLTAPRVLCIEKPYLSGVVAAFEQAAPPLHPFVLLVVNGGDEPFTAEMQRRVAALRGLRACYANNLHAAPPTATTAEEAAPAAAEPLPPAPTFHPLPLGLPGDAARQLSWKTCPSARPRTAPSPPSWTV